MSSRKSRARILKTIAVAGGEANEISVEVHYNTGGMNYFSYKEEARGYYLSVSPYKVSGGFKVYSAFSGVKTLIETANRFGQKKLDTIEVDEATIDHFVELVLEKNGLHLVDDKAAA